MSTLMDHPFPKSMSLTEKSKRLMETVFPEDTLGIIINADPDAMASALALKRIFWRKVRRTLIYHVNTIQRADNLAFIRLLKIDQQHLRDLDPSAITKWALLDSQPHHHEGFVEHPFDIIIDHHPVGREVTGRFVEIREHYGATSTLMTEYLRACKIRPSAKLATALFYGIKTDTDNFARGALSNDINALRYLYRFANMNIVKKIESSEMTVQTLASFRLALEKMTLVRDIAYIHMDAVDNPDILVMVADFFLRLAEATWSIVTGEYDGKLIAILRNADFRGNAGRTAERLFGRWGGFAGGHRGAARAEVPLGEIKREAGEKSSLERFILRSIKTLK